jgi:hypothetical protein
MKLHEYHARSLEATLSRVDEALNRMERLLIAGGQEGVVRKIENTLSTGSSEILLAEVRSLRKMVGSLAQTFRLEPHPLDIRRVLDAEISTMWVLFENCRPERMKGYGQAFAKEAREALEKNVEMLLAQILKLRKRLE